MRFVCSRFVVATAALAYLLANALSALHSHEHGLSHAVQACEQPEHGLAEDCSPEQGPAEHDHAPGHSPAPFADDDCLACRLAAQSAVVCVPLADAGLCPLVVEVRSTPPTFFLKPVHSCGLARAPPLA
jgi:hypothetical protein